ncbi:MAG: methyl-accepting chemotaxis protein [Thiotrichales bacterium]
MATGALASFLLLGAGGWLAVGSAGAGGILYWGFLAAAAVITGVTLFIGLKKQAAIIDGDAGDLDLLLEKMIRGDYSPDGLEAPKGDGILAKVYKARSSSRALLKKSVTAANESGRVSTALDSVSACVMIADNDYNIVYLNEPLKEMFTSVQEEIRKDLPAFNAAELVGKNIDVFHKNPYHQRGMLDSLNTRHEATLSIGGEFIGFVATPVKDAKGNRTGVVVEWQLLTSQKKVEEEIDAVVNSSLEGDLSKRIPLEGKTGFYKNISFGINDLLSVNEVVNQEISRVLAAFANGDLDQKCSFDYGGSYSELAKHLNETATRLKDVIVSIGEASHELTSGSQEISSGNANLSNRTSLQASNLEKTAASMEEMTGTVRQNADNANEANTLAADARTQAERGGDIVREAVAAMAEINSASNKISDIIGVIDEIAFQTNLLALNAAVEAAHAGDQGRGFAVVASEVRNLAQRSAEAAKEIKDLIEDSVKKVGTGTTLVDNTGLALDEIVVSVKRVSDIIAEIAAANQEQSIGIEQVNQAVLQMDEMTQQNASMVKEIASASEGLGNQSHRLNHLMQFFRVTGVSESSYQGEERRSADRPWSGRSEAGGGMGSLDVSSAKAKHLSWKTKIRSFLDGRGTLTMDQAVSHRDCDLGKWLYSEGMDKLGHLPDMQDLEKTHAEMHAHIKSIIAKKEAGDSSAAENGYVAVDKLSSKVVGLLDNLSSAKPATGPSANQNYKPAAAAAQAPVSAPPPANTFTPGAATAADDWEEF